MKSDGTASYFHCDHLGSTNLLTDANGNILSRYEYQPYGKVSLQTGSDLADYKFTGKELDSSGLYYYGARYYDPEIGRFISADPTIQHPFDPQDLNRYAYCRNNPIKYVDPSGYSWWSHFWKSVVSGFAGGITTALLFPFIGPAAFFVGGFVAGATNAALNGAGWQGILLGGTMGTAMVAGVAGAFAISPILGGVVLAGAIGYGGYSAYQNSGWEGVGYFAIEVAGGIIGFAAGVATGNAIGGSIGTSNQANTRQVQTNRSLEIDKKPQISDDKYLIDNEVLNELPPKVRESFYGYKVEKFTLEKMEIYQRIHQDGGESGAWKPVTDQKIISKVQSMIDLGIRPEWGDYTKVTTYGIPKGEVGYRGAISYQGKFALGGPDKTQIFFRYLKKEWILETKPLQ